MRVKEIFYTLQGEGANAGKAAVFCRFTGCNGWSGRPEDREKGPFPCARWCDTDFLDGEQLSEIEVVDRIVSHFKANDHRRVVLTGGEPLLQITDSFLRELKKQVWMICIETNGSIMLPDEAIGCWVTLSPKTKRVCLSKVSEVKVVYPAFDPADYDGISAIFRYIQPLDDENKAANTERAIAYVKANPRWTLSVQTHKYLGIR